MKKISVVLAISAFMASAVYAQDEQDHLMYMLKIAPIPVSPGAILPANTDQTIIFSSYQINKSMKGSRIFTGVGDIDNIVTSDSSGTVAVAFEVKNFTSKMLFAITGDCLPSKVIMLRLDKLHPTANLELVASKSCSVLLIVSSPIPLASQAPRVVVYNLDDVGSFNFATFFAYAYSGQISQDDFGLIIDNGILLSIIRNLSLSGIFQQQFGSFPFLVDQNPSMQYPLKSKVNL